MEEGFLGVADEDGEVEGDAEQLADRVAAVFFGVEIMTFLAYGHGLGLTSVP